MLTDVHPKLPMRNKPVTREFYINKLGFRLFGSGEYPDYLMVHRDNIALHFFLFEALDPKKNYGQVYIRTDDIDEWYRLLIANRVSASKLERKPWGQKEFSVLDPDNNLLTFGQSTV